MARYLGVCCLSLVAVWLLGTGTESAIAKRQAAKPVCKTRPESCRNVASSKPRVVAVLSNGLEVMCDTQTDGGGWTVFQRRVTGALPFYRGWEEYKYGFGDVATGEFYLGNENIHQLTSKRRVELRIDFTFKNASYFAKYSSFRVYGEPEGYRLKISGFTGNAGNSLDFANGLKFSTYDKDQDSWDGNCAEKFKGAYWYLSCHQSNFNGIWGSKTFGEGLNWFTLTDHYDSVTMTELKLRQIGN